MVVVQKATGVTDKDGKKLDVQDVLQYRPRRMLASPIVWTKNPNFPGVTSNVTISAKTDKEMHRPQLHKLMQKQIQHNKQIKRHMNPILER